MADLTPETLSDLKDAIRQWWVVGQTYEATPGAHQKALLDRIAPVVARSLAAERARAEKAERLLVKSDHIIADLTRQRDGAQLDLRDADTQRLKAEAEVTRLSAALRDWGEETTLAELMADFRRGRAARRALEELPKYADVFRAAWHEADDAGRVTHRVADALEAVAREALRDPA